MNDDSTIYSHPRMGGDAVDATDTSFMNCPLPLVNSPQPKRPFKRSLFDLEDDQEVQCNKRQRIFSFLEGIPSEIRGPFTRSRSDSFLLSTMSTRPERQKEKPIPFDKRHSHTASQTPRSVGNVSSASPTSYDPRVSISRSSLVSGNCRVAQPGYRDDLAANGIYMIASEDASPEILNHAHGIINRVRNSPELSEKDAKAIVYSLKELRDGGDEIEIIKAFTEDHIIPRKRDLGAIECGGNRPFDSRAIPHIQDQPFLPRPKPDQYFAYRSTTFNLKQRNAIIDPLLITYSKPATSGYFPFFIIEIKATARMGSIWVAENQATTSTALCVNSMEQLFKLAKQLPNQIDTIAFSCLMDERSAAIWLTYCEEGQIFSMEVEHFYLGRTDGVIGVRNAIRNICQWGLEERLPSLISALEQFKPTYLSKDLLTRPGDALSEEPTPKRINSSRNGLD